MPLSPVMVHLMEEFAVLFLVLFAFYLLRSVIEALFKRPKKAARYVLITPLVSPAERSFLGCLDSVLPPDIRVLVKVRLGDLFSVESSGDRSTTTAARNKIQSKHVDFVLCRSDDLSPLAAIELDDKSHGRSDRRERDEFLNSLFADSPIKLLRIPAQHTYDTRDLARKLSEAMQSPAGS